MLPLRRVLLIVSIAALALVAAGCGVSSGESSSGSDGTTATTKADTTEPSDETTTTEAEDDTTTTEPDGDLTPEEQMALDLTIKTYKDMGLNEKDATCLAKGVLESMGGTGDAGSMSDIMDVVNECDISMDKLAEIGEAAGGDAEGGMKFGLETSLKNSGLTDEQASCVADAYVEEFGTDFSSAADPGSMAPLLDSCGVDSSDFSFGN